MLKKELLITLVTLGIGSSALTTSASAHQLIVPNQSQLTTETKRVTIPPLVDNHTTFDSHLESGLENILTQQIGKPYQWGATGPSAFDCSGLVQYVFKFGYHCNLPRTAEQQFYHTTRISGDAARFGDLIFFSYNGGKTIDHVGIVDHLKSTMVDAQNNGVIHEAYNTAWWQPYIVGFGRVK